MWKVMFNSESTLIRAPTMCSLFDSAITISREVSLIHRKCTGGALGWTKSYVKSMHVTYNKMGHVL